MRPKIFVGSSFGARELAFAVQRNLEDAGNEVQVWSQGSFAPTQYNLEALLEALRNSDFGVFIFYPDDTAKIHGSDYSVVRDNVIFELGLFVGGLGRDRSFILTPDKADHLRIPSDLAGLIVAKFSADSATVNKVAALGAACTKISEQIRKIGCVQDVMREKTRINEAWQELIKGAENSIMILAGDASWAKRDADLIGKLVSEGIDVNIVCNRLSKSSKIKGNVEALIKAGASVRYCLRPIEARALIVDGDIGQAGISMRIQKTQKTGQQSLPGESGDSDLYDYVGTRYFPGADNSNTRLLRELFETHYQNGTEAIVLNSIELDAERICGIFSAAEVDQYMNVTPKDISLRSLSCDELWASCKYVKTERLDPIKSLLSAYYDQDIESFVAVRSVSKRYEAMILPPIVEKHEGRYVVIDGMHRLFGHFLLNRKASASCLVVSCQVPLPSRPIPFREVALTASRRPRGESFEEFDEAHFRDMRRLEAFLVKNAQRYRTRDMPRNVI